MANPGVGNRFTSVNLNKSYGQSLHSNQSNSSNYGLGRGNRPSGGGGGGGMVVLSRPRSSHKAGSKLSVPPPLNLPSLRREHEKFDSLGSGSGSASGGVAGSGARPSSSGMGWSKPSAIVGGEREGVGDRPLSSEGVNHGVQSVDGVNRGGATTAYMPPSARTDVSVTVPSAVEKATVLRGEDFPSLRATLSAANGPSQKQKDSAHQKHRQGMSEEPQGEQREGLSLSSHVDMHPQVQSSHHSVGNGLGVNSREDHSSANFRSLEKDRRQDDYFPGPLPLVRLSPRSDWADDERDTSHGLTERSRDLGFSRTEAYWDRDFDFPRNSLPPLKPAQNLFDRRGQRDNDVGKGLPNEVSNADSLSRYARVPSREGREGHSWRTPVSKDASDSQEVINERNSFGARPTSLNRETNKDNKYFPHQHGGNVRDEYNVGPSANRDSVAGRRDHGRQQWNNSSDLNNGRGPERNTRDFYGNNINRYKADVQNSTGSRSSFSSGNKGLSGSDHTPNFGRDKRSTSRNEKPYVEDPFSGFDGEDPFPGVLGVVKRKKDANKPLDFHDPVRESFEAELERVQKMQEQERQRIIEEQERAHEMARREEEERQRVAREQEEHQRRLEEEAREAAWRSEQERLESIRRAEEQRIAREDEKQRIMMEEDRRKQAAKQKLLELEERIARRQAETTKVSSCAAIPGDIMSGVAKERDIRADDFACWEDGERMVERITNSASSDSSLNRSFDMGSRAVAAREGSFAFTDRGKPFNSWRRDMFENGNSSSFFSAEHENGHQSPRRDTSMGGRSFPRKDLYGGPGYMPTRGYYRGGIPEPHMDDFPHPRGPRWNISGDGDPYGRNMDSEADFPDNVTDRFDLGWGQGQGRGRGNSLFPERLYQNPDLDDLYSYGRSRYPARQPRVLPPPLPSVHRTSFRGESERPDSSAYEDGDIQLNQALRNESTGASYQDAHKEHSEILDVPEPSSINGEQELNRNTTPGHDSQSSLSVSSPPSSPTHLSHDDLDESRESLAVHCRAESQDISLSENEAILLNDKMVKGNTMATASSVSVGDDEEWTIDNNEELPEQEEYDEDADYHEDVHEGDDENIELSHEFEDMHLEGKDSPHMDNRVLGFDQGVEVGIPNEDYEKSPRIDESLYTGPQAAVSILDQKESVDGSRDGQSTQVADVSQLVNIDSSCVMVQETERILEPTNVSVSLDPLKTGDSAPSNVLSSPQSASSPVRTNSLSFNQALPSVAGTKGPADLPVKLQFGLFSGPSLIPSPVPAIQIGSIQMPLQLHPQIGPSLTHVHAPQPPLFQFGQLRYPTPISQGILPLGPQSMSFVQPNFPPNYSSSQVPGGPPSAQPVQDSSHSSLKNHHVQLPHQLNAHQGSDLKESNLLVTPGAGNNVLLCQNQENSSSIDQIRPDLGQQTDSMGRPCNVVRKSKPLVNSRASESRVWPSLSHSSVNVKDSSGPSSQGQFSGGRGRRIAFTARNPGARLSSSANEASRSDTNGFQRKPRRGPQRFEFRVRQTADGKQSSALPPSSFSGLDAKSNSDGKGTGTQAKSGLKKEPLRDKAKQTADLEFSGSAQIQESGSRIEEDKIALKEATATSAIDTAQRAEGSLKRNIGSEDEVDAPLQSGIVRVFKQPGIEAPSDEDDFIEVRSKRQMLNDRREQREKEIKAKSNNMRKAQQKSRLAAQGTATARSTSRTTAPLSAQATKSVRSAIAPKRGSISNDVSATLNNVGSQLLAPIGTPPIGADSQIEGKVQTVKLPQTSSYSNSGQTGGTDAPDLTFNAQGKVVDRVQSSIGSWGSPSINQPVMALTQTQLEEAMKPAHFDKHVISIGDSGSSVNDPGMPSSSVLANNSTLSSATSPINSLLAGEKIQFGAVTSPTVLPPSTRVSHNVRSPSLPLDVQRPQSMPALQNKSCSPLEDCEAEAAASAVAVAAIGNDEVVGNGIGSRSTTISDPKSFGGVDINRITTGMSGDQHAVSQSKGEETLSVSLPADLSVETPPISIWPPIPSPHNSSSHMLSSFPGGPTSHFPYYDMNPMMGGPVFAFGPHEESAGPQPQPQKSSVSSSGPLGTWQQCHTGVDSFYGPPAGFTAPFISPPGSIPGVQGPPHMVVYNHFAPVGQFGQVGLSYMGTTYIPSGKQPDWKRNSASALVGSEGEVNNTNLVPVQRSTPNVSAQVQHLAPGSPLLSMASPLAMFEVSPFQSSPDVSVHPRWSHVQSSSIHTVPQSLPLQQQAEDAVPFQSNHGSADHHSLNANGFSKTQTSSSLEDGRSFAVGSTAAAQFPNELGLVNSPISIGSEALALHVGSNSHSGDSVKVDASAEGSVSQRNPHVAISAPNKAQAQSAKQKNPSAQQQYNHYQRGGGLKNGSGAEWSNRKMGFHGRNHSSGGDRSFPPAKVKQIYVAKQNNTSGTGAAV